MHELMVETLGSFSASVVVIRLKITMAIKSTMRDFQLEILRGTTHCYLTNLKRCLLVPSFGMYTI
jgi:hypothetical protein